MASGLNTFKNILNCISKCSSAVPDQKVWFNADCVSAFLGYAWGTVPLSQPMASLATILNILELYRKLKAVRGLSRP